MSFYFLYGADKLGPKAERGHSTSRPGNTVAIAVSAPSTPYRAELKWQSPLTEVKFRGHHT